MNLINVAATIILSFSIGSCGNEILDTRDKTHSKKTASPIAANLTEGCEIDWPNFEGSFSNLPESCVSLLPSIDTFVEELTKQGRSETEISDLLQGLELLKLALKDEKESTDSSGSSNQTNQTSITESESSSTFALSDISLETPNSKVKVGIVEPTTDGNLICEGDSISLNGGLGADVPFVVESKENFIKDTQTFRKRKIYADIKVWGEPHVHVSGSLFGSLSSLEMAGTGRVKGKIFGKLDIWQLLGRRERRAMVASATASVDLDIIDKFKLRYDCSTGGIVTDPSGFKISFPLKVRITEFYGLLFPRLKGPLIARIREIVRNWFNNNSAKIIDPLIAQLEKKVKTEYDKQKSELVEKATQKLSECITCEDEEDSSLLKDFPD